MNTNVKGGAYLLPDGRWVNAKGQTIPAPKGPVYEAPEETVAPGSEKVPAAAPDEYGVAPVADKPKRVTKKS